MRVSTFNPVLASLLLVAFFLPQLTVASGATGASPSSDGSSALTDWRVTGPTGGDVRALVVDPNDENRFYFGTLDGQIYSSTDGGKNWSLFYNFNRPQLFVDNILVDRRDSKTLYVATHRHKVAGGFYKTIDGGKTWRLAPELKDEALHSLTQSEVDPNVLVTGSNTGVFRSTDSGDTWTRLNTDSIPGLHNVESLAVDPRNADVIYAGTWYLPYKTVDAGKTWSSIKTGMIDDSDVFAIDIDPRNPDHIIASACSGIYDSPNGGDNWRKIQGIPSQSRRTRAILQHPSVNGLVFAGTTEGFWRSTGGGKDGSWTLTTSKQLEINSIAVHPKNPLKILIATNNYGVMMSLDGGKNFIPSNGGFSGRFANTILSDRERPGRVYASTINSATGGGFFFVSNDNGDTWRPAMRNMPPRLISYSVLQDEHDGNLIYLGTNNGLYISTDRGESWGPVNLPQPEVPKKPAKGAKTKKSSLNSASKPAAKPDGNVKRAQEALNSLGFKVGVPDGFAGSKTVAALRGYQSDKGLPLSGRLDQGTLLSLGISPDPSTLDSSLNGTFLTVPINVLSPTHDEKDGKSGILAATNIGLYRTYDPSKGWEKVEIQGNYDQKINTISVGAQSPRTIWIGTTQSGVLVTRDGGHSWEQVADVPTEAPVSIIKQDPVNNQRIYVGTKQSFYCSYDDGRKWLRRGGNLPYGEFATIVINPRNPDEIYVGNAFEKVGGVFRSSDAGQTWVRIDPRDRHLPSVRIWALELDASDSGRLFVGSHSAGVYVADRESSANAIKDSSNLKP
jgi:photosystem II stability/assembly factor-like uncharacterized protein